MRKDDLDDLVTAKAAKLLRRTYRRQRVKSWSKVAARFGLTKARCYRMAHGTLRVNVRTDHQLLRALLREDETRRAPVKMRRLIRKIALPFLARRQRSASQLYTHGGGHYERS